MSEDGTTDTMSVFVGNAVYPISTYNDMLENDQQTMELLMEDIKAAESIKVKMTNKKEAREASYNSITFKQLPPKHKDKARKALLEQISVAKNFDEGNDEAFNFKTS